MDESEYRLKKRESLGNRNARIQDNKKTHYVAGYDPPQMQSEQVCQVGILDIILNCSDFLRLQSFAIKSL